MKRATDETIRRCPAMEHAGDETASGHETANGESGGRRYFLAAALAMLVAVPTLSGCETMRDMIYCEDLGEPEEDKPKTTIDWMNSSSRVGV